MNELNNVYGSLLKETKKYIVTEGDYSYVYDPFFNISRSRVTAEVCKAMIRSKDEPRLIENMTRWIAIKQNHDGSWNEEHPKYSKPSALATAFAAEALLLKDLSSVTKTYECNLVKAKNYILNSELSSGFFKKSESYLADHLNVDASCGAFLAEYGRAYDDQESVKAASRAAFNCISNQFENGVYPYTTSKGGSPYPYPFNVPCVHYQGVTIYYLLKIQNVINDDKLGSSLIKAVNWLSSVQMKDGRFDWSKSGLMFAYYLSGAYAFAAVSFKNHNLDAEYLKALKILDNNAPNIANRWERAPIYTYLLAIYPTLKTAMIGDFPIKHRMFRLGYGLYRQFARRRYKTKIDDQLFNVLSKALRIKTSTIDPSANYPDLFMTSEIVDCLSYIRENQT